MADHKSSDTITLSELHRSVGKRLVITTETDEDVYWSEALVKKITGERKVQTKAYHKDTKEENLKFTPVMMGNHRPKIKGKDDGIWRRMRLIPYNYMVPDEKKDVYLLDKLTTNDMKGKVLDWLIAGHAMYKEQGLSQPLAAVQAVDDYKKEMNPIEAFIEEVFEPAALYKDGITLDVIMSIYNNNYRHVEGLQRIQNTKVISDSLRGVGYKSSPIKTKSGKQKRHYKLKVKKEWELTDTNNKIIGMI